MEVCEMIDPLALRKRLPNFADYQPIEGPEVGSNTITSIASYHSRSASTACAVGFPSPEVPSVLSISAFLSCAILTSSSWLLQRDQMSYSSWLMIMLPKPSGAMERASTKLQTSTAWQRKA
jgi:hypothetical protein